MKERPILMSAPMVRAILDGRKTQTRRVIKVQPSSSDLQISTLIDAYIDRKNIGKSHWVRLEDLNIVYDDRVFFSCPFGKVGDGLWVRENWQHSNYPDGPYEPDCHIFYRADYMDDQLGADLEKSPDRIRRKWKPSIHMPRMASRILLEITNISVERLQDISEADAIDEGVNVHPDHHGKPPNSIYSPVDAYRDLFESIYGEGSWNLNPYVWVIEFNKI